MVISGPNKHFLIRVFICACQVCVKVDADGFIHFGVIDYKMQKQKRCETHLRRCCFRAGMGNLFTITSRVNCGISLEGRKN